MSTDYDQLDDHALVGYLEGAAREDGMRFVTEERDGEWFAESRALGALGEMVVLGANGPDRRTAMLRLAALVADR